MATTTQIVPEHDYAHVMCVVHDNSQRPTDQLSNALTTYCNMLFVFSSPKGIDRQMLSVSGESNFTEKFGLGSYDAYGQPYLNALAAARTNAVTLHCMRVTADDASYAAGALVAHYKVTPGTDGSEPTVTPTDKLSVNGHANVIASDGVSEDGATVINIAGTDVAPGISAENALLFPDMNGDYIDVTLDLSKVMTIDPEKTYQIKQTNPALEVYSADENISNATGQWVKTKTYLGSDFNEGYAILVGANTTATVEVAEWGTTNTVATVQVNSTITNDTDLGVTFADDKITAKITNSGTDYTIEMSGEAVSAMIHPDLWGSVSGSYMEVDVIFPGLEPDTNYKVIQVNPYLENYSSDPSIKQESDGWTKNKDYAQADIADGYAIMVGNGPTTAKLSLYKVDDFVSVEESAALCTVTVTNNLTFVPSHTEEEEPMPGPIGDTTTVKVVSALSFVSSAATKSVTLRAAAAYRSVMRNITTEGDTGTPGSMEIYYTFEAPDAPVTDLNKLGSLVTVDTAPDENGYTAVKMFEVACRGRGKWGNNIRFVMESYVRGDRLSNYKNYLMSIYEINNATLTKKEEFQIAFNPNAVNIDGAPLFADYIVCDPYDNSQYINMVTNPNAISELFAAYATVFPSTTLTANTFDPFTGLMFGTTLTTIEGLTIDTTSNNVVSITGASGIALMDGSDGAFDESNPNRQTALNDAYLRAYSGEIDRNILSRKMYPTDLILDANFSPEVKHAIHDLVETRDDCVAIYDLGTEMNTFAALMSDLASLEPFVITRSEAIDGYYGRIQDPVTFKIVPVTSTYALASMYPLHFQQNGGKHVPLAGSAYAVISGYLSGTAWPVYDDDLDSTILDTLTESKVNFLKINSKKQVVRGAQTTRQDADTNLSELSNVFVLNDIKRDAIQLCEQYEYNFAETSDLQRFNKAASILAEKYQDAQVKSISAEFSMNDWESERGILHLYIDFVHKNIIKRSIVEITVNRGTVTA